MENKYSYSARITDEDNDQIVAQVFSYSEEGLLGEMGKGKWTDAIRHYEKENDETEEIMEENFTLEEKEINK